MRTGCPPVGPHAETWPICVYSMMEKPLLKSVISNIQGDKVIFKGNEPETGPVDDKDEGSKTVANMAKSAMKKDRSSAFKI